LIYNKVMKWHFRLWCMVLMPIKEKGENFYGRK